MKRTNKTVIITWLVIISLLLPLGAGGVTGRTTDSRRRAGAPRRGKESTKNLNSQAPRLQFLAKYATNLTALAVQGQLATAANFADDVDRIVRVLARETGNNALLIEHGGAVSLPVAQGVALKIASGAVLPSVRAKSLWHLDFAALQAGARDAQEVSARLKSVLADVEAAKDQTILFIDDLSALAGAHDLRQTGIAELLRERLSAGKLHCIGAASENNFKILASDEAELSRQFQQIAIGIERDQLSADGNAENIEEQFVGDKLSPDLRELTQTAGSEAKRVRVIIQTGDAERGELRALLGKYGVRVNQEMSQLNAFDVTLPVRALEAVADSNLTKHLSLDREVKSFGHVEAAAGAAAVRLQVGSSGLDGTGISIAVLDSSIFDGHHAFLGKDGNKRIKVNVDFTKKGMDTSDPYGHGTHVAALAAGSAGKPDSGLRDYKGIAPNANLINLRVLDEQGVGRSSGLLNALNWVLANRVAHNIKIVNLSLGAPAVESYKNDPLCRAVRRLTDAGVVVVAASGNNGKNEAGQKLYGLIHAPGNEPSALTVGATNTLGTDARDDDMIATYSSRGPTRSYWTGMEGIKHYDNLMKPDLVAPGNKLIAAEAKDNYLVENFPNMAANDTGNKDTELMSMSGSSMATPIVSGAAALMLQANPKLTPNMVKMILMYTAQQLKGFNSLEQGAGQVNIEGAVRLAKLVRTDLDWAGTAQGTSLLTTTTLPAPHTTIAGHNFSWAQGILLNRGYATGSNLIAQFQNIYSLGIVLGDGLALADGLMLGDGIALADGIVMGDNVLTSNGIVMGDGLLFLPSATLSGSGIALADGLVLGDGILTSDGIALADGVVMGDAQVQALSTLVHGDDTPAMK